MNGSSKSLRTERHIYTIRHIAGHPTNKVKKVTASAESSSILTTTKNSRYELPRTDNMWNITSNTNEFEEEPLPLNSNHMSNSLEMFSKHVEFSKLLGTPYLKL